MLEISEEDIGFYKLIDRIRKRPTLVLPRKSIFDFQAFYFGYTYVKLINQLPETDEEKEFELFLQSIREQFPVKTSRSWANIIMFYSVDEADTLNRMFNLFDNFLEFKDEISDSLNLKIPI